jgi:hypothetical protein
MEHPSEHEVQARSGSPMQAPGNGRPVTLFSIGRRGSGFHCGRPNPRLAGTLDHGGLGHRPEWQKRCLGLSARCRAVRTAAAEKGPSACVIR